MLSNEDPDQTGIAGIAGISGISGSLYRVPSGGRIRGHREGS